VIGWLSLLMCGALFQFVPVLIARPLHSNSLPLPTLACLVTGLTALLLGFLQLAGKATPDAPFFPVAAGLLGTGFGLALWNLGRTLWSARPLPLPARFVAVGLFSIGATVTFGVVFALVLGGVTVYPHFIDVTAMGLPIHVIAGLGGWLTFTAMGVSYRLLAMFMLAPELDRTATRSVFYAGSFALALVIIGGAELLLKWFGVPQYVLPTPSQIITALFTEWKFIWPHLLTTLYELLVGFAIGASIGFVLAAVITQFPFVEKIVTPYILLLVTTPMLALVPLLILKLGFGSEPRIIAVALASGPMVMINSATGFRRVDLAKIALARSFGASTLQIFTKIRIPMAMPMIIVGLMVGSIFGLLTTVGAEMVGGAEGLGNRLTYYSALIRMPQFFAVILILAIIGISIYVLFYWIGKKWASWEA